MLETHTVAAPPWLTEFVEQLTPYVYTTGFPAPLSYGWWEPMNPANDFPGYQIAVNLLPLAVQGGAHDGGSMRAGIRVRIFQILRLFSAFTLVEWYESPRYNDPVDSSELRIEGTYQGHLIRLRVLASTPPDDRARLQLNADTDELKLRTS